MKKDYIKIKKYATSVLLDFLRLLFVFGIGFIILKPIIGKILLSIMSPSDLLDNTVSIIPKSPSFYYWREAIEDLILPETAINTFLLSLFVAIIQTVSSVLVGYGLARFKFKGQSAAFVFVLILLLVPFKIISIAQYQTFNDLSFGSFQLVDTFWPLIILAFTGLGIKGGLYIYLMRENFRSLPASLEEAAYIDGAGVFKTFLYVMLPNTRTMIATIFLFSFCWQWTDETYTSLYFYDTKVFASQIDLIFVKNGVFIDSLGSTSAQCAGSLIVTIPLIGLFILCQRLFVKSISTSGLAGT